MLKAVYEGDLPGARVTDKMKEDQWQRFLKGGTAHSSHARTLPDIMNRCEREKRAYILEAKPGQGYFIRPVFTPGQE